MSPQPISRVKPGAFPIILPWSIAAFGETPKSLAVLVARVVMTWARCESTLALMMAAFLKADFGVAFAMLDALTSSEGRLAAITGAAREALPPHRFEVFQATLRVTKASRNRRNEYVHHIWAYTPQVSDGLLLIDPRLMARIEAEDQERMTRGESRVAQIGMGTLRP